MSKFFSWFASLPLRLRRRMLHGAFDWVQFVALSLPLVLPGDRCPDLVCPEVTDQIPSAVEGSLEFAISSAEQCSQQKPPSCIFSFWLFWLGLFCGLLLSALLLVVVKLLRTLVGGSSCSLPPLPDKTPAQPALPSIASPVVEPHNPNTLRQLGLLR